MRIYPAPHYTMGGLWVDYNLMTTIPGLFAVGEANFSDHGANRLGASSLMQCLADGYFVLPSTIGDYLSRHPSGEIGADDQHFKDVEGEVKDGLSKLMSIRGNRSASSLHRELGKLMIDYCGISRNKQGLEKALSKIPQMKEEFWAHLSVPGSDDQVNQALEHAGRLSDFYDFANLMCRDALHRDESCGCHFREEHQTPEGEALRNDDDFANVSAWQYRGEDHEAELYQEPLKFEAAPLAQRNYKT